jgi:hypothetical protein
VDNCFNQLFPKRRINTINDKECSPFKTRVGNLLGKKINHIISEAKREEKPKEKKRKENGPSGGSLETRVGGIAETAWEEANVRGCCLFPQIPAPRDLSLCLALSPQIGTSLSLFDSLFYFILLIIIPFVLFKFNFI